MHCSDIEKELSSLKSRRTRRAVSSGFDYNDFNSFEDVSSSLLIHRNTSIAPTWQLRLLWLLREHKFHLLPYLLTNSAVGVNNLRASYAVLFSAASVRLSINYDVCVCVSVRTITERPLIRNSCNLVRICVMVILEVIGLRWHLTLTYDLENYFSISTRHPPPV